MYVIVLNDGQTYSNVDGCHVIEVPPGTMDVDGWVRAHAASGIEIHVTNQSTDPMDGDLLVSEES